MESSTATTVSASCSEWTKLLWTSVMPTKKENPGETVHWLLCESYVKQTQSSVKYNLSCCSKIHYAQVSVAIIKCILKLTSASRINTIPPQRLLLIRLNSIDVKYQIWKLGVVFTDNVSRLSVH